MPYRVEYSPEARRAIRDAPAFYRAPLRQWIERLAQDPRPAAAEPLRGIAEGYKIRIRGWRLAYQIREESVVVLILRVGRKTGPEFYEDLPVTNGTSADA